jgi:hypothetical protein
MVKGNKYTEKLIFTQKTASNCFLSSDGVSIDISKLFLTVIHSSNSHITYV